MHIDDINSDTLQCMQCESEQDRKNVKWNQLKHTEVAEKLERVGIICPSNQQERQKAVRQMNKMVEVLKRCYSGYNSFLDNKPKPYPTSFAMSDLSKKEHTIHGRRFEVSMYMFQSDICSCCGRVKPGHVDPYFPRDSPFERRHLLNQYHKAWVCTCSKCKGCQFYCHERQSHIKYFQSQHNGVTLWDFLRCSKDANNAVLCESCYKEVDSTKVNGKGKKVT